MKKMNNESFTNILPKQCRHCPRGVFNDFWCVWADTQCYKDALKKDNTSVARQAKA